MSIDDRLHQAKSNLLSAQAAYRSALIASKAHAGSQTHHERLRSAMMGLDEARAEIGRINAQNATVRRDFPNVASN